MSHRALLARRLLALSVAATVTVRQNAIHVTDTWGLKAPHRITPQRKEVAQWKREQKGGRRG